MISISDLPFLMQFEIVKLYGNPEQERNINFLKFMIKNIPEIYNFRVPKNGMSGLPYLRRGSWNYFLFGVIKWFRVQQ